MTCVLNLLTTLLYALAASSPVSAAAAVGQGRPQREPQKQPQKQPQNEQPQKPPRQPKQPQQQPRKQPQKVYRAPVAVLSVLKCPRVCASFCPNRPKAQSCNVSCGQFCARTCCDPPPSHARARNPKYSRAACDQHHLSLSGETCRSLHDIRLLGEGASRSSWTSRSKGQGCQEVDGLCHRMVVRKSSKNVSSMSRHAQEASILEEAKLFHALRVQNGPQASVRSYGLCCNGTSSTNDMSSITEMLDPIPANFSKSAGGRRQLELFVERMSNFSAGPLELPDLDLANLGLSKDGQVHAFDLGWVHISEPTASNRQRVNMYMLDCLTRGGRSSAACKHGLLFVYAQRTYAGPPVLA